MVYFLNCVVGIKGRSRGASTRDAVKAGVSVRVLLLVVVVWVVITCARWLPEQMLPWNFKRRAMRLVNIKNLILYIFR